MNNGGLKNFYDSINPTQTTGKSSKSAPSDSYNIKFVQILLDEFDFFPLD